MQTMNNSTALDDYRNRLRQSLDASRAVAYGQDPNASVGGRSIDQAAGAGPQAPTAQPSPPAGGTGMDPPAPDQTQMRGQQPMSIDQVAGRGAAPKPQKQPTPPPVEFNKTKLADAKTMGDHVEAMKPDSANRYMNWWEKQYGSINNSHDNMLSQLGEKPDENRPMSRKEKFAALMDFGINLIKSSQGRANDPTGALSTAVGATAEGLTDKRKHEGDEWAAKAGAIQGSRAQQLKGIGTYGQAAEGQARINNQEVQSQEAQARIDKAKRPNFEIVNSDQGIHRINMDTGETKPVAGLDGKPLTNLQVGTKGGAGRDSRPAQQKLYEFLKGLGKTDTEAEGMAFHEKTGDPRQDHLTVYSRALTATFGDAVAAKKIADDYIAATYPEGTNVALDAPPPRVAPRPVVETPPVSALARGRLRTMPNGTKWTLDADGNPKQVK